MGCRAWLVCGLGAALLYVLLPDGLPAFALAIAIALGSVAVMLAGVHRRRPVTAGSWYVFAAGICTWVVGDILYAFGQPFPSWADAFYLGAYPLLTVALFRLTRQRGPVWSGNLIDSAIIGVGLGIVYWTFLIEPIVADSSVPPLTRAVIAGYPTAGVLLCAVIIPILLRRGPRTASLWLLTAGSAVTLVANVVYTLVPAVSGNRLLYAAYLVAYVLFAAAAAHPSTALPVAGDSDTLGRSRLTVLTASTMLVPALLLVRGDWQRWGVIAVGSMVLFALVASRMSGYVARVDSQARQLRHLAMHDDLTGLPNSRELEHRVAGALNAGPCHVIVIDLAGFRHVNDRLGRAAGDQALVAVGELLRACCTGEGEVVARMGADEFGVLTRGGAATAHRLLEMLRHPIQAGEHELLLTPRLGIAAGETGMTAVELVRRADTARYAAKSAGTPLVAYSAQLDARAEAAERLGADLRHSIDDGDFRVVYQPIVELRSGRIVAVEALVRWHHPLRGQVSPADFIPIAENNGLIVELGEWIMRTACARYARWRRELGDVAPQYVSVNVSARQLSEPGFPDVVAGILMDTGVPPSGLLVEVTETAIFGGGVAIEAVENLHRAGVRIALDDFGTGHSSLGLLRAVPVDVLKVDKSFVDEIIEPGREAVIVGALIHVSNGLGLRAVAEGVETAEQADHLRELGYHYAQGYLFGRPVEEPEFAVAATVAPSAGV